MIEVSKRAGLSGQLDRPSFRQVGESTSESPIHIVRPRERFLKSLDCPDSWTGPHFGKWVSLPASLSYIMYVPARGF